MSNFVSYNSSAGSGKTFTLVKEYLKIALETDNPNQYRKILAITFTNKAASEMKERVLSALKELSGSKKMGRGTEILLNQLTAIKKDGGLEITPAQVKQRSKKVLKSILHNYYDFGISTIDKFTHKIIRTFAHDLQLPLNFNIELNESDVMKAVIDMLITEVGNNEKLTKILVEYAIQKSDDEKSWKVENDLLEFSQKLLKDGADLHLENIRNLTLADFENIKEELYKQTTNFELTIKQLAKDALKFIDDLGIERSSFSYTFYPGYWVKIMKLEDFTVGIRITERISGDKNWCSAKVSKSQKELVETHKEELIKLYNESRTYIDEFEGSYIVNKSLVKNLYNIAVLNEIEKTLVTFKQENNILNISDFNKRIAAIVASEPVPFIYERLGEKYHHYLIDEFQDTSIVQWHNLLPLVDNSLAMGKFNMVVGDAKQAIYRFRGGEVEQIINFPKIYKHNNNPLLLEREASVERNFEEKKLENNYRSKAEIVDFNNQFFQSVATNLSDKYQELYKDLKQGFIAENTGGGIEIQIIEESNAEENKLANHKYILTTIKQCLDDGYSYKDIAILTRGRDSGKEIAVFLLENNIQVISAESLLLTNSDEVNFLIDILGYLSNPSDKNYQIKALTYLTQTVFNDDLFEIVKADEKNMLMTYLKSKNIDLNFKQIANYSLYELIEHLLIVFALDKSINIYLQFFLDKVHEYASKYDNSILNFMEWWELKSYNFSVVIPDGVDAIQVMTIHKSKGLEFPVVIYPFASSSVTKGEDFFWTDKTDINGLKSAIVPINEQLLSTTFADVFETEINKSKLDLINLIYVAFTRPKDRLYILSKKNKEKSKNGSVADYLLGFCQTKPDNKIADLHYRFGEFDKNTDVKQKNDNGIEFENTSYNNWRNKIQISYQAPKVWEVENPETIGEYGTLIHNILSKIKEPSDLEGVLASYLLKGIISDEESLKIKAAITDLFTIDEINNLFMDFDELKNERSILLSNGESYQPDRVVVKNNQTFLVDYKTGEREEKHKEQITNYCNLLSEMGYQNINAQLLYIKDGSMVEV